MNWLNENIKDMVQDLLKAKLASVRLIDNRPFMLAYHIALSRYKNIDNRELLIFIIGHLPDSEKSTQYDYLNAIQTLVIQESLSMETHLLLFISTPEKIQDDYQSCLFNFMVIDSNTFKDILSHGNSKINDLIQKNRPTLVESPFKYLGPCAPDLFVGREDMIAEIIDSDQAGYAITGGRRVGKTSLLLKIQNEIAQGRKGRRYDNQDNIYIKQAYDCCYVDCINLYSFQDVHNEISRKMQPRLYNKKQTNDLTELVGRTSALQNKKLLLLLDEMDDLMEMASVHDKDAREFQNNLQKAANNNMLKFVICGFRNVSQVIRDSKHPFFNLCKGMYMNTLKKKDIRKLLIMSELKQVFEIQKKAKEKVVDKIYDVSGGYPSVVQFIADQLIRTDREGMVSPNTIEQIMNSDKTKSFVLETLMMNTNTFERLICILAVNLSTITNETVINALLGKGVKMNDPDKEVLFALKNLVNNCIIYDYGNSYTFLYPLIPVIIKKHLMNTSPRLLKTLANQQ